MEKRPEWSRTKALMTQWPTLVLILIMFVIYQMAPPELAGVIVQFIGPITAALGIGLIDRDKFEDARDLFDRLSKDSSKADTAKKRRSGADGKLYALPIIAMLAIAPALARAEDEPKHLSLPLLSYSFSSSGKAYAIATTTLAGESISKPGDFVQASWNAYAGFGWESNGSKEQNGREVFAIGLGLSAELYQWLVVSAGVQLTTLALTDNRKLNEVADLSTFISVQVVLLEF